MTSHTNPPPYDIFPLKPPPPHYYNDTRITYNEKCFFYNGGFDFFCLYGYQRPRSDPRHRGKSTSAIYKTKSYPEPKMVELFFKTCFTKVNEETYENEEYCETRRYEVPINYDTEVKIDKLRLGKKEIGNFEAKIEKSSSVDRLVSSSINWKTLNITKPYVSSSLILNKPRKIIIKTRIKKSTE